MTNHLSVLVTRGGLLESSHQVQAIFIDQKRKIIFNQDSSSRVFPRSSIKIFQAIPFIQSNAIDKFNLTANILLYVALLIMGIRPMCKLQQIGLKR